MDSIIEVSNLSKYYQINGKKVQALPNLSFTINSGNSLAVIGPNGSGKTTLLKLLSGIIKPSTGTIQTFGSTCSIIDFGGGLHPDLNGYENIFLGAELLGFDKRIIEAQKDKIIEFSGLSAQDLSKPIKYYSNGMYLRLAFSIYSNLPFNILIIDELLSVGDKLFIEKSLEKISFLQASGVSIIFATHDFGLLSQFFPQTLVLGNDQPKIISTKQAMVNQQTKTKVDQENHSGKLEKPVNILNQLVVKSIDVKGNLLTVKRSEKVVFNIEFEVNEDDLALDFVVYVDSLRGPVITDCILYDSSKKVSPFTKGDYSLEFELPELLLNPGVYFLNLVIGDKKREIFKFKNVCKINIEPDDWEKDKPWNFEINKYPCRPTLNFNLSKV